MAELICQVDIWEGLESCTLGPVLSGGQTPGGQSLSPPPSTGPSNAVLRTLTLPFSFFPLGPISIFALSFRIHVSEGQAQAAWVLESVQELGGL